MKKQAAKTKQLFLAIGAIMGWFAIIAQFYLLVINRITPLPETIIRFFSYYTILTNILVALYFTVLWLKPRSGAGLFFSKPATATAITVYITVVGMVYNLILRAIWNPHGLQMLVDELLHLIIPLFFIAHWIMFTPKAGLKWKNVFPWLIYPFVYLLFILIRGTLSGFYPYPFIDVKTIGYNKVFLNIGGLFIVFFLLSLAAVAIGGRMSRHSSSSQ